jgi:hypothetical protein
MRSETEEMPELRISCFGPTLISSAPAEGQRRMRRLVNHVFHGPVSSVPPWEKDRSNDEEVSSSRNTAATSGIPRCGLPMPSSARAKCIDSFFDAALQLVRHVASNAADVGRRFGEVALKGGFLVGFTSRMATSRIIFFG